MKIVNSIQPEPEAIKPSRAAPEPPRVPIAILEPVETPVDPAPLFDEIERLKNSTLQDLQQIEERLKLADADAMELVRRNAADIARLALEFDTLKKVMVELTKRADKPAAVPAPVPVTQSAPVSEPVKEAPPLVPMVQPPTNKTQPSPLPDPEKKVALFGKLWNYLNQTDVK